MLRSAFALEMTLFVYGHVLNAHRDEHGHFLFRYVIFFKYTLKILEETS